MWKEFIAMNPNQVTDTEFKIDEPTPPQAPVESYTPEKPASAKKELINTEQIKSTLDILGPKGSTNACILSNYVQCHL